MLTLPQIELMQSDLPHTLYKRKSKDDRKSYSQSEIDEATRLTELARQKAEERRRKRQKEHGYKIDEIFNGEADND